MELKFNKNGDAWVAEFEATDKFNLHMEGLLLGSFSILQRTAGGKYTHVRDIPTYPRFDKVFDYDFNALVYPKFIKIVSETEPTYAEVVSDGEITEIKSQTKEVEVTANGTTQVAPDAGYSYLTGVTVKTNVPQSGGSGGGTEGGEEAIRYIKILNPGGLEIVAFTAAIVKCNTDGVINFYPNGAVPAAKNIVAAGVIVSESYQGLIEAGVKLEDAFTMMESGGAIQTITKEEFYNLEGGGNN